MNRQAKLIVTTALAFFLLSMALNVALLLWGIGQASAAPTRLGLLANFQLLQEAFGVIRSHFVDEAKTEPSELIYGAIDGFVRALDDPYSRLMRPDKFKDMQTSTKGSFGGLGIIIGEKNKRITVVSPIKGSPAYDAGLHAGDVVVKVDGVSIEGQDLQDVVDKLRGPIGTKVSVSIFREGEGKLLDFTVVRAEIQLPSVRHHKTAEGLGYLNITSFIQTTGDTVDEVVGRWEAEGTLKALVVDVRGNPGGLLNAAVRTARVFLGREKVVSVKSRTGDTVTYSSFRPSHARLPLVVLIDRGSASASEILAGAIKDNGRGLLLGETTFGKGSVQTVMPLSDGSALAITTAYYYTPSGICIHKTGIEPHVTVAQERLTPEQVTEYRRLMKEAYDESMAQGSVESGASQPVTTHEFDILLQYDTQLQRASDLLRSAALFNHVLVDAPTGTDPKE